MIGMGTTSVSNIKNGKDGATGMGIESTYVQYCYGASGTNPPGEYLVDENGNYLVDQNGNYFTNGQWRSEVPKEVPGLFLWSKTVTVYEDGTESVMYSLGKEGTGIISEKRLYYLSSSMDGLQDGFWTEEQPYPIPDGYYLWGRYEFIMSDGSVKYTNPIYEKTLSGVISEVDNANLQIRNQVWKTDITNMIGEWDTTNEVTRRVNDSVTDINGIWTSITNENQKTVTKADGTTVTTIASRLNEVKSTADEHTTTITQDILGDGATSLKSIATQTADHLAWIIDDGTDAASMTLTSTALSIIVRDINLQGRVSFSDLKSDVGSKVNLATSWTEVNVDPNVTTINGGFIRSHTIVAEHLNTNAIKSFGKYNAQTGKYTGGYARDKNSTYSTTGSFFDMENGNIFTPSFSIINTIPTGETLTAGGYFKGTVTASGGSIGGWTIENGILYSGGKTPSSTSIILKPGGIESNVNIGGSNPKNNTNVKNNWALTIKDDFGVTTDGYMYATNANISGVITATSGSIGGITIDSNYGIYTNGKTAANSTKEGFLIQSTGSGAMYFGAYDSENQCTVFQVNQNGYLKTTHIDAYGGTISGWNFDKNMMYYGSSTPSSSSIILAPKGKSATMYFYDSRNTYTGSYTKNWAITAGGGFGVTTAGEVFCSNAHVSGEIYATAGEIGGCAIVDGVLTVNAAYIDHINADLIDSGKLSVNYMDFSELENLDDLAHTIGNYLELGENSGFMFEYDEDSGDAWICYGKDSLLSQLEGFYLGSDGISIGADNPFIYSVEEGILSIEGDITATSGSIGNWIIDVQGYLRNSDASVYISSGLTDDDIYARFGKFEIQNNGNIYAGSTIAMHFYDTYNHGMTNGPVIQAVSPNDLNVVIDGRTVASGIQDTWVKFGSYADACIAMPAINPNKIYVKMSDDGWNWTWYNLKECLDAALEGGGTSYSFDSDEFTVSNNTVSLKYSYLTSSDLSGYATQTWVNNKGYLTSIPSNISCNKLTADTTIYISKDITNSGGDYACLVNQNNGTYKLARREGSSSKRYKDHKGYVSIEQAQKILDIPVINFVYKEGYLSKNSPLQGVQLYGFYAEDVEKCAHQAVYYNSDGLVENWKERDIIPLMLRIIQDQQQRIEELEKKLAQ